MAADITTVLELDDSKYNSAIKNAENNTKRFADNSERALNRLEGVFAKLNTVIGAIGLGKIIADSLALGTNLTKLSQSTNIAAESIRGLQLAFGDTDKANDALSDLVKNMGEATNQGGEILTAFNKIGIGLKELTTLSEKDLMRKTIEGLAKIPDAATRSSTGMKLMGEAVKTIDFNKVNSSIDEYTAKSAGITASAKAAADSQRNLKEAYGNAQEGILAGLQPLNENLAALTKNTAAIAEFTKWAVRLGTIAASFFLLGKAVAVARVAFAGLAEGWAALTTVGSTLRNFVQQQKLIFEQFSLIGGPLRGLTVLIKGYASTIGDFVFKAIPGLGALSAAYYMLSDAVKEFFGITDKTDNSDTTDKLKEEAAARERVAKFLEDQKNALDAVVTAYQSSNAEILNRINLDTKMIGKGEEARKKQQALADAEAKMMAELTKLRDQYNKTTDPAVQDEITKAAQRVADAYAKQKVELQGALDAQIQKERANQLEIFSTQKMFDNNQKLKDIYDSIAKLTMPELSKRYQEIAIEARKSADAQIQAEERRRGSKLTDVEKAKYYEAAAIKARELTEATKALYEAEIQRERTLAFDKEKLQIASDIRKVNDDLAKLTMTELEKKEYDIKRAAEERARAYIEAENARTNTKMTAAEEQAIIDRYITGTKDLTQATKKSYEESRSFATGWKQAMNQYVEDVTDGASKAKSIFGKAMSGMEDLITNFAKTGKFEWKKFVSMMLEELLRSQIQMIFAQMLGDMSGAMKNTGTGSTGSSGGGLMDVIGGLFGSGNKNSGQGTTGSSGSILGSTGSEIGDWLGFGSSSSSSNNPQTPPINGGGGSSSGGIWDTISNIGTSVWDSVSSVFDGWFANGGDIKAGHFGVVGEAGPELIQGPASVTPAAAIGGNTQVTYNINAVDARSFKEMLAQDPSFLYGVTMQGAKGIAGRR